MAESGSTLSPIQPQGISVEEKKRFLLGSALPAMTSYTSRFICGIVGVVEHRTGRHLGSALRCMLKDRPAILTALHVIQTAVNEPHGFAVSAGYGSPFFQVHGDVNVDSVGDLAVYFLPDLRPHEFAIEYAQAGMATEAGTAAETVDPRGLSGSPVWRIGISGRTRREWKAQDSLLVGVVTQWRPQEMVLIATSTDLLPQTW
jgi:hypothetical protein